MKIHPHDTGVLRELIPILAAADLIDKAVKLASAAYEYFQKLAPHYTDSQEVSGFEESDLDRLAHLLLLQDKPDMAIKVIKQGQRWLQGREKQTGWDVLLDDREFDRERKVRKNWEKDAKHLEEAPVNSLDLKLRLRLGVARLNMGRLAEAQVSFRISSD